MVTLIMRLMTSTKTVETAPAATTGLIEIPKLMTGELFLFSFYFDIV